MIEIKDLNKAFEDKIIFRDFNMTIEDGALLAVSGKSGSGKSTLLNMLGALDEPDSGEIIVDGIKITSHFNKRKYYKEKIGFLFQNFALVENRTVRQNLSLIQKSGRTGVTIEEALEKVGLSGEKDTVVYKLSGGEQQRVALARLMIKKCDIILADEPTGSLDPENSGVVMKILKDLNRAGKTVIIVTHDRQIAKECGKTILISDKDIG